MDGIEKIIARINQDAQSEIDSLVAETNAKVAEIAAQAKAQADKETADALARGRKAADERKDRLVSAAQMETRKLSLAAKQEVLGEAFDLALQKLCSLSEKDYVNLLTKLAVEASATGREQLVFSRKDRARVGKQVVMCANEALNRKRAPGNPQADKANRSGAPGGLTLAEETRSLRGGFIMLDNDVEINCAFETLVRLQREKLELAVAGTLFET